MKTNDVNITTVREAFDWLDSLPPHTQLILPPPGERNPAGDAVECITGEPVTAWIQRAGGRRSWSAWVLGHVLRAELRQRLAARFAAHTWPVNLAINGDAVNHSKNPLWLNVDYSYRANAKQGARGFKVGVAVAATHSRTQPTQLRVMDAESCPADVLEYLAALLNMGFGTTWPTGERVEFDEQNFAIDLHFDITNPATWDVVDRITRPLQANT